MHIHPFAAAAAALVALPVCSFAQATSGQNPLHSNRQTPGGTGAVNKLTSFAFQSTVLDAAPANLGWALAEDIDNDGDTDVISGGGNHLLIWKNQGGGTWAGTDNLDSTSSMGANGAVIYDVNGDGFDDVVSSKRGDDHGWWEHPGDPIKVPWQFHKFHDVTDSYMHDILVADLDSDGVAEEFITNVDVGDSYWNAHIKLLWFRPGPDPTALWQSHVIEDGPDGNGRYEGPPHGHSGMDVGDITGDGNPDLAFSNGWYESQGNPTLPWTWRETTTLYGVSNTLLRDMDKDGDLDMVMAAGHHGFGIYWYENDNPYGAWNEHSIDPGVEHPEGLQVLDLDADGHLEIVGVELFFDQWTQPVHNVFAYEYQTKLGAWAKQTVLPTTHDNHLIQAVDLNGDCKLDLLSQTAGDTWVSIHVNATPGDCE